MVHAQRSAVASGDHPSHSSPENFPSRFFDRDASGRYDNGAKLVTFDVRLSNTAGRSDEWLAPFPGTEGAVALAMAYPQLPDVSEMRDYKPKLSMRIFSAEGKQIGEMTKLLMNAYRLFMRNDLSLLEINPLIVTADGHLVALDWGVKNGTAAYGDLAESWTTSAQTAVPAKRSVPTAPVRTTRTCLRLSGEVALTKE